MKILTFSTPTGTVSLVTAFKLCFNSHQTTKMQLKLFLKTKDQCSNPKFNHAIKDDVEIYISLICSARVCMQS